MTAFYLLQGEHGHEKFGECPPRAGQLTKSRAGEPEIFDRIYRMNRLAEEAQIGVQAKVREEGGTAG